MLNLRDLRELNQARAVIESFAPKQPSLVKDKPMRIGVRLVPIWVIPVQYVEHEQLIAVRIV